MIAVETEEYNYEDEEHVLSGPTQHQQTDCFHFQTLAWDEFEAFGKLIALRFICTVANRVLEFL